MFNRITLRLAVAGASLAAAAATAAFLPGAAHAASRAACPPPPHAFQPFAQWGDGNGYVLTTGGSFESGPAWSLSGNAAIAHDNAPNALDAATDEHALYLPAGSSATSACVTAPRIVGILRFFARSDDPGSQLQVEVLVKGHVYQAGVITAGPDWAPSPMLTSDAPDYKGAVAYQVRLTALSGSFTVDDVYFDPFYRG